MGQKVLKSITPGQQIVKIIHDELVNLMGKSDVPLKISGAIPSIIMLSGLQGSGKTTLAGKLGLFLKKKGHKPVLVAADIYRPAAVRQLEIVGENIDVPVISDKKNQRWISVCLRWIFVASTDTMWQFLTLPVGFTLMKP